MEKVLPSDVPDNFGHRMDLDTPSGEEFVAAGETIISNLKFVTTYLEEVPLKYLYYQLEYSGEFGNCLCTLYGAMTTLSMMIGRELTKDERYELCKLRYNEKDFQRETGGFVSVAVDVVRRWWNKNNPNDQIITLMMSNRDAIREAYLKKGVPVVRSMRGNRQFTIDSVDGVLDKMDYHKYPRTYGHCTSMRMLLIPDNYGRSYSYKTIEDYQFMLAQSIEGGSSFVMFRLSDVEGDGRILLDAMKAKVWNGERPDDNITRQEVVYTATGKYKLTPAQVKKIWNQKDGPKDASKYETSVIYNRASDGIFPIYTGTDRNQNITREQAILALQKGKI